MAPVTQAEYTIFAVYIDVATDIISVWLLYLVHDFFLDRFIVLYLVPDSFVHLFNFLSHDIGTQRGDLLHDGLPGPHGRYVVKKSETIKNKVNKKQQTK